MDDTDTKQKSANKSTQGKLVTEMSKEELENYRHRPKSELSALVCQACETGDFSMLKEYLMMLSETSPDKLNEIDNAGMTSLHFAVSQQNLHAVKLLVRYGAEVDVRDALGFTPLFLATGRYPDTEISEYLIEQGRADVQARTKTGATALHGSALQANADCVKLLLKHGADPRTEDEDGTTAFELAKDDATRAILHDAIIEWDLKKDTIEAVCAQCKQIPKSALKRCGQCHVTLYCSRECQTKHWKEGGHKMECTGYVVARPTFSKGEKGIHTSFYKVMGSSSRNTKVFTRQPNEAPKKMEFLRDKLFVVKVQVPIGVPQGNMMVYNADRTVEGFVYNTESGYDRLADRIRIEGMLGIKAFFWAELTDKSDGTFKIYHGKCAPFQQW